MKSPDVLIVDQMGTPGEGTRPARGRFCERCRPGALTPARIEAAIMRIVGHLMEVSELIQCPFCGQSFELLIDTSLPLQQLTTDCEICCRPFEVSVECEPGQVLNLEVESE